MITRYAIEDAKVKEAREYCIENPCEVLDAAYAAWSPRHLDGDVYYDTLEKCVDGYSLDSNSRPAFHEPDRFVYVWTMGANCFPEDDYDEWYSEEYHTECIENFEEMLDEFIQMVAG